MKVEQGTWEQLWLPIWPLASDDLRHGIYRQSRRSALGVRYIEANPHAVSNLLVVDIDHPDALMRAQWNRHDWLPNAIVENPENGHAHAVWAMREPITRTEYGRKKPLAFAAAVTEGLRRSVDGDHGYSGLITKNPMHEAWEAHWLTDHLYELDELREHLTEADFMPERAWNRSRRKNPVGLGRNCSIFETARTWAYQMARTIRLNNEYPTRQDRAQLHAELSAYVHGLNAEYSEQLPYSEAKAIIASIDKWITTKFTGWTNSRTANQEKFATIQRYRGLKGGIASGEVRRKNRLELFTSIVEEATA